jgi:hypothetical protein
MDQPDHMDPREQAGRQDLPTPGPACARFDALLPLLDSVGLAWIIHGGQ